MQVQQVATHPASDARGRPSLAKAPASKGHPSDTRASVKHYSAAAARSSWAPNLFSNCD